MKLNTLNLEVISQEYFLPLLDKSKNPFFDGNLNLLSSKFEYQKTDYEQKHYIDLLLNPIKIFSFFDFSLYDYQKNIFNSFINNRFILDIKSRQIGYSMLITVFLLYISSFKTNRTIVCLANKGETINDFQNSFWNFYIDLPNYLKPQIISKSKHEIKFSNGNTIRFVYNIKETDTISCDYFIANEINLFSDEKLKNITNTFITEMISRKESKIILSGSGKPSWLYNQPIITDNFKVTKFPYTIVPDRDCDTWISSVYNALGDHLLFDYEYGLTKVF